MWLFLFLVISASAKREWRCPYMWKHDNYSNRCYKIFREDVFNHSAAEDVCARGNATLGVIETKETLQSISDIFLTSWRILKESFPADRVWISSLSSPNFLNASENSRTSSECYSLLPSRSSEPARLKVIPCNFPDTNKPVQHVLCQSNTAVNQDTLMYCDEGWSLFEDRNACHRLFQVGISSYDGAEAFCNANSANVSMLLTEKEKEFVQDLMTNGWKIQKLRFPMNQVWLGMKKIPGIWEYKWNNGIKLENNDIFETNEPNGALEIEPCVTINPFDVDKKGRKGALSDISCDNWLFYLNMETIVNQVLCEKPAVKDKALASSTFPTDKTESCTDDWSVFSGSKKCHKLFQIGVTTMDGARKICHSKGGRLSSIETKDEVQFVTEMIQSGWKISGNNTFYNHVWVSLTRDSEEGKWRWNGKEELNMMELGEVAKNSLEVSNCAAYQPKRFIEGKEGYFGEVPCDTAVHGYVYPPSHILCERDQDGSVSQPKPSSLECPENWHFHKEDEMCIKLFVEDSSSFQYSQNKCSSEGGSLVSVNTDEKREFVIGVAKLGWRPRITDVPKSVAWVGLRKEGNTWKWINGDIFDVSLFTSKAAGHGTTQCGAIYPTKMTSTSVYGAVLDMECDLSFPIEHLICEKDSFSKVTKRFWIYVGIGIGIVLLIILFITFIFLFRVWYRKRKGSTYDKQLDSEALDRLLDSEMTLDCAAPFLSFDPAFEVSTKDVELIEEIGQGFFGVVWKAKLNDPKKLIRRTDVAVKHVRDINDIEQCESIATEIKFLSKLGSHPNVIKFIGAITSVKSRHGNMLIMEFCSRGNLRDHLLSIKNSSCNDDANIINFAFQIACGMKYISSIPCIHRDLAARNVLLNEQYTCKITDFGLAKNEDYYKSRTSHCLPFRWMAPETIECKRFTLKSDVWSFGIVLFEIFSFGSTPYPDVARKDLIPALTSGKLNEIPTGTSEEMASLMELCWKQQPQERPTFDECFTTIREYLFEYHPEKLNNFNWKMEQELKIQPTAGEGRHSKK